jgi:hypothetical protein
LNTWLLKQPALFFLEFIEKARGQGKPAALENFVGRDADESYMGEASVYKAQLCAQLNDTRLCRVAGPACGYLCAFLKLVAYLACLHSKALYRIEI